MKLKYLLLTALVFSVVGCSSIGPGQVDKDRKNYQQTIAQTDNEQMLSNIFRVRYLEQPSYMRITNDIT